MTEKKIIEQFEFIEKKLKVKLPREYLRFLSEEVKNNNCYEVTNKKNESVYIFNNEDILEINETYTIQDIEPNCLLIGQDGDLGYFIRLENSNEKIYCLDLGALGSEQMEEVANNLYDL